MNKLHEYYSMHNCRIQYNCRNSIFVLFLSKAEQEEHPQLFVFLYPAVQDECHDMSQLVSHCHLLKCVTIQEFYLIHQLVHSVSSTRSLLVPPHLLSHWLRMEHLCTHSELLNLVLPANCALLPNSFPTDLDV